MVSWLGKKASAFDIALVVIMLVMSFIFLYPIYITVLTSISEPTELMGNIVYYKPFGFTMASYELLLGEANVLRYYLNTIIYAASGTVIMLLVTSLFAYPMIFSDFRGRKFFSKMLIITMFFSGGIVPAYLNAMRLNIIDTIWVMILPGAITAYNTFVFITSFRGIPSSIREAALIDGAGHFRILFSIILPLSKALLATFALFSIVGYWNDYLSAFLFMKTDTKWPIQMFLRKILIMVDMRETMSNVAMQEAFMSINPRTVQSAAIMITIIPILCVYPFLQKFFAQGVMLGSIKE